jgi:hypothetical protein
LAGSVANYWLGWKLGLLSGMEAAMLPEPTALTADQIVAIFDAVETAEVLTAAHAACDSTSHAFSDDDRGRVASAFIAATSRVWIGRTPKCSDCG